MGGALLAISAPVYWLGLVSLYLFSDDIGKFGLLPGSGAYQDADGFFAKGHALVMPWIVLSMAFAAIYARLLRANLLETLSEDYIRTARAKGLSERRVVLRHAIRSAVTPIVTVLGLDIGILFGGAILTETVFNIPGVGRYAFDAIERGDLATIQGTTRLPGARSRDDEPHRRRDLRVPRSPSEVLTWRCWKSRTSRCTSTPTTVSSRPSTASPTPSSRARRSASSASPARASRCRR